MTVRNVDNLNVETADTGFYRCSSITSPGGGITLPCEPTVRVLKYADYSEILVGDIRHRTVKQYKVKGGKTYEL